MRRLLPALLLATTCLAQNSASAANTVEPIQGRILFVKDGDLWFLDANGPHPLATGGTFSQPTWAPDGNSLAYVYRGTNFADIFVTDDQGQNQVRLTNSQSTILDNNDWNLRPAFSPDGKYIAYDTDHSSTFPTVALMNADGSGRRPVPAPGIQEEDVDAISWSPDGSQLAVTLYNDPGPAQIALIPLGATIRNPARVLTDLPGGAVDPAWSPDGNWLAFAGHDANASEIYVVQPDGSSLTRLTTTGLLLRSPTWSPDGLHLAFLSNKTGFFEIFEIDLQADASGVLSASQPRQLTEDMAVDAASGLSWGR